MENKNESKEINIKNRTCYYFELKIEILILVVFY